MRPVFREIDSKSAEILGISIDVDELWRRAWEMMKRRTKGAGIKVTPRAEGVEISSSLREAKRKESKRKRRGSQGKAEPLTKWFKQGNKHATSKS